MSQSPTPRLPAGSFPRAPVALVWCAFGLLALGCSACSDTGGPTGSSGAPPPSAAPAASASAQLGALDASCAAYLAAAKLCIEKAPEAERAGRREALSKSEATFLAQAADPQLKANLKSTCDAANKAVQEDPACK